MNGSDMIRGTLLSLVVSVGLLWAEYAAACTEHPNPKKVPCVTCCPDTPPGAPNSGGDTSGGKSGKQPGGDGQPCPTCGLRTMGVPELKLDHGAVKVEDTPIWFDAAQGPSFMLGLRYNSLDERTNRTWAVGYRWQHDYECWLEASGANRLFYVAGGAYFEFR